MAEGLTFRKIAAGHYATADGRYAVQVDGLPRRASVKDENADRLDPYGDRAGGEWAAIYCTNDENLDWYATKREAVECAERHARAANLATPRERTI